MEYYKKINLKCESLIREYVMQNIGSSPSNVIDSVKISHTLPPDLLKIVNDELAVHGIPNVWYCQSYIRRKGTVQGVHMDGVKDLHIHAAINLPIQNTKDSRFTWYNGSNNTGVATSITGTLSGGKSPITYHDVVFKDLSEAAVLELDQAYLIRVDTPHSAAANKEGDRWIFTMRFVGNPTFEELYEKLPS
jgi:hypothetical protein